MRQLRSIVDVLAGIAPNPEEAASLLVNLMKQAGEMISGLSVNIGGRRMVANPALSNPAALIKSCLAIQKATGYMPLPLFVFPERAEKGAKPTVAESLRGFPVGTLGCPPVACDWPFADCYAGAYPAVGNRGAGKTTLMDAQLKVEAIIRCSEPPEPVDSDERVLHAESVSDAMSFAIILSLAGLRTAIDSFRDLVFLGSGSTLAGGIDSGLFTTVSSFNNVCAHAGVAIPVSINPMVDDTRLDYVYGTMLASTAGGWQLAGGNVVHTSYRGANGRIFTDGAVTVNDVDDMTRNSKSSLYRDIPDSERAGPGAPKLPRDAVPLDDDDIPTPRAGIRYVQQ